MEKKINRQHKFAFTLAEVLITLGIIGVVAALTLPTLIQDHREKETIAKLKKFYSTIQQAQLMVINNEGPVDDWGMSNSNKRGINAEIYYNKTKEFLNLAKDCGININCIPAELIYKYRNGTNSGDFGATPGFAKAVLTDGSMFFVDMTSAYCHDAEGDVSNICGYIIFDTNGYKKPNKMGDDLFYFIVLANRIIPRGIKGNFFENCYIYGGSCAAWVIYNENMDYKHCNDLNWEDKLKCK